MGILWTPTCHKPQLFSYTSYLKELLGFCTSYKMSCELAAELSPTCSGNAKNGHRHSIGHSAAMYMYVKQPCAWQHVGQTLTSSVQIHKHNLSRNKSRKHMACLCAAEFMPGRHIMWSHRGYHQRSPQRWMYLPCQCYICTMCLQLKAYPTLAYNNYDLKPRREKLVCVTTGFSLVG